MDDSLIFSSKATFKICSALALARMPLSFRELNRRADIGIRSTQLALAKLMKYKLIKMKRFKNQTLYQLLDKRGLRDLNLLVRNQEKEALLEKAKHFSKTSESIIRATSELTSYALKLKKMNPHG